MESAAILEKAQLFFLVEVRVNRRGKGFRQGVRKKTWGTMEGTEAGTDGLPVLVHLLTSLT